MLQTVLREQTTLKNHQQMAMMGSSEAPDVMAELFLDIACQNKFMPFKGLVFPSLHHKPHYNTHLFWWKDTTPDLKQHTKRWEGGGVTSQTMCGCVKWKVQAHNTSFLSNSSFLHALNASWLQVPLGIASLMNANGKAYFGGRVWIMEVLW